MRVGEGVEPWVSEGGREGEEPWVSEGKGTCGGFRRGTYGSRWGHAAVQGEEHVAGSGEEPVAGSSRGQFRSGSSGVSDACGVR